MKISVIMAAHNRAGTFLLDALKSFKSQDWGDKELIVLDGGDDNAGLIVSNIFPKHEGYDVRYMKRPDFGPDLHPVAPTWNMGLRMMKGDAWVLLDDDNMLWPETSLSSRVKYLQDHPDVDVVYGSGWDIDAGGNNLKYFDAMANPPDVDRLWDREYIHWAGFMWRRRVKDVVGEYDGHLHYWGDYDYKLRCLMRCKVSALSANCFKYRIHPDREIEYVHQHPEVAKDEDARMRDKLMDEYIALRQSRIWNPEVR